MCMYVSDGNGPSCYVERDRKARKDHICGECRRTIKAGEVYRVCSGVWEGVGRDYKMCAHCTVAADWLSKECGGYLFESIEEDICEHVRYHGMPLARIAVGMKRCWETIRGELMPVPKMPEVTP